MDTLFGLVNGDEIYATFAILEQDKSGATDVIFWFSRAFLTIYVAVFTVVVINLLIAIFMSAYDEITVLWGNNFKLTAPFSLARKYYYIFTSYSTLNVV